MSNLINLIGKKFNRLTVLERVLPNYINGNARWKCLCDCGNIIVTDSQSLKTGNTQSCGCLLYETRTKITINKYELNEIFGIGYDIHENIFYFDLDDFEKIKEYHWRKDKQGYFVTKSKKTNKKALYLHRMILNINQEDIEVDHIDRDRGNNRKKNLRIATQSQNSMNSKLSKNNSTGFIGVQYNKKLNNYTAFITVNRHTMNLGTYKYLVEAVIARLKGEKVYFKDFSPQQHLFKEFGIQ